MKGERGIGSGADIGVTDFSAVRKPLREHEVAHTEWQHLEPGPPPVPNDGLKLHGLSEEISDARVTEQKHHSEFSPEFS